MSRICFNDSPLNSFKKKVPWFKSRFSQQTKKQQKRLDTVLFHVEIPERERSKKKQNPIVWPLLFCKSKKTPIGILGPSNAFSNVTCNNNSPIAFLKQKYHPFKNIQTILVTIYQTKKYNHLKFATRNKNLETKTICQKKTQGFPFKHDRKTGKYTIISNPQAADGLLNSRPPQPAVPHLHLLPMPCRKVWENPSNPVGEPVFNSSCCR